MYDSNKATEFVDSRGRVYKTDGGIDRAFNHGQTVHVYHTRTGRITGRKKVRVSTWSIRGIKPIVGPKGSLKNISHNHPLRIQAKVERERMIRKAVGNKARIHGKSTASWARGPRLTSAQRSANAKKQQRGYHGRFA